MKNGQDVNITSKSEVVLGAPDRNIITWCVRCECSDSLTCVPKPARRDLRRLIDAAASSLNRPLPDYY